MHFLLQARVARPSRLVVAALQLASSCNFHMFALQAPGLSELLNVKSRDHDTSRNRWDVESQLELYLVHIYSQELKSDIIGKELE